MDFSRMFDEGRKPSLAVTVVTVKPGFTCKFNGCPCEIIGVSAAGMSADLRVAATGERLRIVSATELRCVLAPASVEAV